MSCISTDFRHILFQALSQDTALISLLGGAKIYDRVPKKATPPYIVIGRTTMSDWSTGTEDGSEIIFFIHVWSRSANRDECHEIQEQIKTRLALPMPEMADNQLINLRFQYSETNRDRSTRYVRGVMRFRAVTEPK